MEMAFLGGNSHPSVTIREVTNVPRQYEREEQSREKQSQANDGQLRHLVLQVWANVLSI